MSTFIGKTRLIAPILKKGILRRDRLLDLLQSNLDKKLILITGGAGYGKTTLLAQLVNELKKSFIFYTAHTSDSDLTSFLSYLIKGISNRYEGFGSRTHSIINTDIEVVLGTFVNELVDNVKDELFIILDDYHLIENTEAINNALYYLLTHTPYNIHFIIGAQTITNFSISNIRVKGELLEITNKELIFTKKETQTLFIETYHINFSQAEFEEIDICLEGWITALQLLSYIILMGHNPKRSDVIIKRSDVIIKKALEKLNLGEETLEYFQNELFELQPETVRSFLVKSAILEEMIPSSCDYILKRSDSLQILNYLVENNLFTFCVDKEKEVYYYHHLFRNFLLNKFRQQEDKNIIKKYHLSAGIYFEKALNFTASIEHYLSANETERAIQIIETKGETLLKEANISMLEQWLKRIPNTTSPTLLLYQAEVARWRGKWDEAMKLYQEANKISKKEGRVQNSSMPTLGMVFILRSQGNYKRAITLAKTELKLVAKKNSQMKIKWLGVIGTLYARTGNYTEAISNLSQAIKICKKTQNKKEEMSKMYDLAIVHEEIGEYDKSFEIRNLLIKKFHPDDHFGGSIYSGLGFYHAFKGDFTQARENFAKAFKIFKSFNNKRELAFLFSHLGLLNLMKDDHKISRLYYKRALKLNESMKEIGLEQLAREGIGLSYIFEYNYILAEKYIDKMAIQDESFFFTKGEIKLGLDNFNEAEKLFTCGLKSVNKFDLVRSHTGLARLYSKKWNNPLIIKHTEKALELANKYGYDFAILKLGRMDAPLLQFAIKHNILPHYAKSLMMNLEKQYDLMVYFLGGLKIKSKGEIVNLQWKTQKAKSLFAYLLINKRKKLTTDQLMELFWPGKEFNKSRASFYKEVSFVRAIIAPLTKPNLPIIEHREEMYGISLNYKIWMDIDEFEGLINEAREWKQISEFYMEGKDFKNVIKYSMLIIETDEFYEPAYLKGMIAYAETGNRKSAIDLYRQMEKTLKAELNAEPSDEAKRLFTKLIK
ncbi:MAG: tetratricopeptide repeat protein [Candidatus Stahlbacteria bacterium]|nr:tetratricopeptide repeat protein [Candidatus Stahlbacteria bacterium]